MKYIKLRSYKTKQGIRVTIRQENGNESRYKFTLSRRGTVMNVYKTVESVEVLEIIVNKLVEDFEEIE